MDFWVTIGIATIPAIITSCIGYFLGSIEREKAKSELMVIKTAKKLLAHKSYTDRSFEAIKKCMGGWDNEEDELRRILICAGAVRVFRDDVEYWYDLKRSDERIAKLNSRQKAKENS